MPLFTPQIARKRRALLTGVLALLAAAPAVAQQTGTLRGIVVDADTHQPIARVLIESPNGGAGVLTDNAGRFSLSPVPLGAVHLQYHRPGYFDAVLGQPSASRSFTLAADTPEQTLPLTRAATLHGQLVLPDGDSAAGLRVDLYQAQVRDGRRGWRLASTVPTRNDGSFGFNDLQAGSYLVHAQGAIDPVPLGTPPGNRSGYAPVFAPNTGSISEATVYVLRPGEAAEVRLRLTRAPFYPVRIGVAGEAMGRSFEITGNGFTHWTPRYSREDNAVETELPSGAYSLRANGGGQQPVSGEAPFHVDGAPVSGPVLTVNESGRVRVETQVEAADPGSTPGQTPRLAFFTFAPIGTLDGQPSLETVDFDAGGTTGTLRTGLAPGQYWVSAMGDNGYPASLTSGGVDLFSQPLSVLPGTAPTLSVTLRADAGSLSVEPAGELASVSCHVQIIPLSAGGLSESLFPDGQGAPVVFKNLPPGDYLVLATAAQSFIAFREPGVLQDLQGERVTVKPGGASQVTLNSFTTPPPGSTGAR